MVFLCTTFRPDGHATVHRPLDSNDDPKKKRRCLFRVCVPLVRDYTARSHVASDRHTFKDYHQVVFNHESHAEVAVSLYFIFISQSDTNPQLQTVVQQSKFPIRKATSRVTAERQTNTLDYSGAQQRTAERSTIQSHERYSSTRTNKHQL